MQGKSFATVMEGKKPENWREETYYRYWMHLVHHDVPAHLGQRRRKISIVDEQIRGCSLRHFFAFDVSG
ncbi:MAG: sulfatase/phosphatase domain-containing protein [Bacteroidota bacterium]